VTVAAYLAELRLRGYAATHIVTARNALTRAERFIGRELHTATEAELLVYLQDLQGRRVLPISLRGYLVQLRGYFAWLVKRGHREDNPVLQFDLPKVDETLPVYLRHADVQAVLKALRVDSFGAARDNVMMHLLYYTGMRASEVLALTWEAIDLADMSIRVNGKGRRWRLAVITTPLAAALVAWAKFHPTGRGPLLVCGKGDATALGYQTFRYRVRSVVKRAGLNPDTYTPHKFRHTFATAVANSGLGIDVAKKLLGHRQLDTTMRYVHAELGDDVRAAINSL